MKARVPDEPVDPRLEDDIEDDEAHAVEAPPQQTDDAPPPQPDYEDPHDEQVGQENKNKVLQAFLHVHNYLFFSLYYM
jgi:hypothetical protein